MWASLAIDFQAPRLCSLDFLHRFFRRHVHQQHRHVQQLGKQIKFELVGEDTELDRTILEKLGDPLVHLIRNACDHGLELPEERTAKGKPSAKPSGPADFLPPPEEKKPPSEWKIKREALEAGFREVLASDASVAWVGRAAGRRDQVMLAVQAADAAQPKKEPPKKEPPRKPGALHVYDGGSLFTEKGIDKAKAAMGKALFERETGLTVETHAGVPKDRKLPDEPGERARFFESWAKSAAAGDRAKGVFVLVCRSPGYVEVLADKTTRERGFTNEDEQKLRDTLLNAFRDAAKEKDNEKKQFEIRDKSLSDAVDLVIRDLKDSTYPTTGNTSANSTNNAKKGGGSAMGGIGGLICLGLCVLLCIWVVIGLIRALTGGGGGGGYGGGGGGWGGGFGRGFGFHGGFGRRF